MQTVTLSAATTQPVTYPFVLAGTTATAGTDFTATSPVFSNGVTLSGGVLTVPAGVTSFTVTYPTTVDALADTGETTALTVGGVTGVGTINDPANPTVSVGNNAVVEGTNLVHAVTLSAATTQPAVYPFTLVGTTATAGTDFTATPVFTNGVTLTGGNITVPAGVSNFTVSYPTTVDALADTGETTALTIGGSTGVGTINDSVYLSVTKTASQTPLAVGKLGQFYTITIAIANGPTTAPISLVDVMPVGITLSAAPTATGGVLIGCPTTGSTLSGCMIATNTSGPVVITVPVFVGVAAAGTPAVNSATISGGGDSTCPAAAHCTGTVTTPVAAPDMQVTPSTSLPPAVKNVPYPPNQTITCTNVSTVDAANAFCTVTDLPPGLISTCTPVSPVALLPAGEKIVCTISGTPTVTVAIKAKVVTGADGDTVNTNNDGVLISVVASLSVSKTVSANPLIIGAVNQYYSISITVTNGPTVEAITLNDNFATGITTSGPVSISGGAFKAGTCAAANSAGATSLSGCQIEPGVTGTVYINVPILVDDSAEGPSGGNNTVTASGGGDPLCPVSTSCIGSTGTVAVIYGDLGSLFIRKVADRTAAEIGDVITYKLTVRSTKIKGVATVKDRLPLGFKLIANTTRVSKNGTLVAASDPAGAPGPDLTFTVQIPVIDQDVEIEYKVRVGLGSDRGDGVNSAQASMVRGRLQSMIAKAKVKISGGVFTREACIVGKVYADCNGNAIQDTAEPGIPGVTLYMEDGTSMTSDENGLYSICGVRAITHVLKVDNSTLPTGSKLGITSSRNVGDPNSLFVDVLAGELHNTEFRLESCTPQLQQLIDLRKKGQIGAVGARAPSKLGGVQFDSSQLRIPSSGLIQPVTKTQEAGVKQ